MRPRHLRKENIVPGSTSKSEKTAIPFEYFVTHQASQQRSSLRREMNVVAKFAMISMPPDSMRLKVRVGLPMNVLF